MAETVKAGPGGYREVSGTAGTPHGAGAGAASQQGATPFTPPDTSSMGYGAQAGGTAGPGGNSGGKLAGIISTVGRVISLLPEAAAL